MSGKANGVAAQRLNQVGVAKRLTRWYSTLNEEPPQSLGQAVQGLAIMLAIMVLIGGVIAVLAVRAVDRLGGWVHATYTVPPSASMEPTLTAGESVDVNLSAYQWGDDPEVGDIVVFNPPMGAKTDQCGKPKTGPGSVYPCARPTLENNANVLFIGRVVAGPNDRLTIWNGRPAVNGTVAREDFITPCRGGEACNFLGPITVSPPDFYFVMGDNRGESHDSRYWGPIPRGWIVGRVEQ